MGISTVHPGHRIQSTEAQLVEARDNVRRFRASYEDARSCGARVRARNAEEDLNWWQGRVVALESLTK